MATKIPQVELLSMLAIKEFLPMKDMGGTTFLYILCVLQRVGYSFVYLSASYFYCFNIFLLGIMLFFFSIKVLAVMKEMEISQARTTLKHLEIM